MRDGEEAAGESSLDTAEQARRRDRRLDMELDQTFPASDPIPWIHEHNLVESGQAGMNERGAAMLYLEDLTVGQVFVSASLTVTADDIKSFASAYDPQPFHLDEGAAEQSPFGGLAASGWHTAALSMRLLVESDMRIAGGLLGVGGEISWPRPTRPGDALRVECEVIWIKPSRSKPDRGIVTIRMQTLNQDDEAVQIAVMKMIVPRR